MADDAMRQPHASLNLAGRLAKGLKVERMLELPDSHQDILEIGTGSGGIAHYFGAESGKPRTVEAVDVADQRQVVTGYNFTLVSSTSLPFADARFDAVISNHVIEHVGDRLAQVAHLKEIGRVLRESGKAYLAVPNRWMLVEPHYGLPLLSWLPRPWRSRYVRMARKGKFYDCEPLTLGELKQIIQDAGLIAEFVSIKAFRTLLELERPRGVVARLAGQMPDPVLRALLPLVPTHICILRTRGKP